VTKVSKETLVWKDLLEGKVELVHLEDQGDLVQKEKLVLLDFLDQLVEMACLEDLV